MIVWLILLGIVLLLLGIVALVRVSESRRDREVADTANWVEAEATIQEGRVDRYDRHHWYPFFAFSYIAAGDYLSGEFCLEIEGDRAQDMIKQMLESKFTINFDPSNKSSWYIPTETMEGCQILFRGL